MLGFQPANHVVGILPQGVDGWYYLPKALMVTFTQGDTLSGFYLGLEYKRLSA